MSHPRDGVRPRILLYSHDFYGLGHLRRTLAIAGELSRRSPDAGQLVLTGALRVPADDLPANLDYIKMPSFQKYHLYEHLTEMELDAVRLGGLWLLREAVIRQAAMTFAPHAFVVDDPPPGENREVVRTLTQLHAARPRPALIAGLRDISDNPDYIRKRWQREGTHELLDHVYDYILIYGSREVFDPIAAYGLSKVAAAKVIFTGYVTQPPRLTSPQEIRQRLGIGSAPLVVVTLGGGERGLRILRPYLQACRAALLDGLCSFVVTGPNLPEADRVTLAELAGGLEGVSVTQYVSDMPSYINAANVVITALGYNSACESVGLGKWVLAAPTLSEQHLRALRFQELGLVRMLDWSSPERLAAAVHDALSSPPPTATIDLSGLRRVGDFFEYIVSPGYFPA